MSRTPVREALKLLETEGLVELRSNRGATVSAIAADEVADLFEVAAGLERMAAELAAARISSAALADLHRLQDSMDRFHAAGDLDLYFETNQAIHKAIVAASGNKALRQSHELIFARVERVRYMALTVRGRWSESVKEHHDILAALDKRDSAEAGRMLEAHVQRTGTLALDLLSGGPTGDLA
jgi:DNA-binding GntR family transcriptional regulator